MELETSEKLEKELNEQIEALQMQLEKEREDEAVQMKQSEEVHLSLAGLDQQKTFIVENISRIDEEITRYEKEQEELAENRGDVSEEIRAKKKMKSKDSGKRLKIQKNCLQRLVKRLKYRVKNAKN